MRYARTSTMLAIAVAMLATPPPKSQQPPPSQVRFTEVKLHAVRQAVVLPGTVESSRVSEVASEVEGLVRKIHAREGTRVKRGAALVTLSRRNLELKMGEAQGQLTEARARLDLAEQNLARAKDLRASGVISERDLDDAISERLAWQGRIDSLESQIERNRADLERCAIRAPFAGVVVEEQTEIGQWVNVGTPVASLVALDGLEVAVEVGERYFSRLVRGTRATVRFESLPDVEVDGNVSAIVPNADPRSRTFPIKVRIPRGGHPIGVGMLAQVSLPLGEPVEALIVPKDAVVSQGPGKIVYRIGAEDTVEPVGVRPGVGYGEWIVVEGELDGGERVVTRGNERLRPGQAVAGSVLEYPLP